MYEEVGPGYAQREVEPILRDVRDLLTLEVNRADVLPTDIGIHVWVLPKSVRQRFDAGEYLLPVLRLGAPLARRIGFLRWPRLQLLAVLRVAPPSGVTRSVLTGSVGYVATGLASVETTIHSTWAEGTISRRRYRQLPHSQRLHRTRAEMNRLKERYGSALAVRLVFANNASLGCITVETPVARPLTQKELDRCVYALTLFRQDLIQQISPHVGP